MKRDRKKSTETNKRKAISRKLRFDIFNRDEFKCTYCGQSAPDVVLHVDHKTPVSKGGASDPSNLTTACSACNFGKSDTEIDAKKVSELDLASKESAVIERDNYACLRCGSKDALRAFPSFVPSMLPSNKLEIPNNKLITMCYECRCKVYDSMQWMLKFIGNMIGDVRFFDIDSFDYMYRLSVLIEVHSVDDSHVKHVFNAIELCEKRNNELEEVREECSEEV